MKFVSSVLLVFSLLVFWVAPARADAGLATWPQRVLRVEDRTGDPRWRVAAIRAIALWNATGADIKLVYTTDPSFAGYCGYHDTTVSICRAEMSYYSGLTHRIYSPFMLITGAFIEVSAYQQLDDDQEQAILCHELGHAMGLEHSSTVASCMFPYVITAGPGPDAGSLVAMYP